MLRKMCDANSRQYETETAFFVNTISVLLMSTVSPETLALERQIGITLLTKVEARR